MPPRAYDLHAPTGPATPVVFASPHSGRHYDAAFLGRSVLTPRQLRSSEDAFIDRLFGAAPDHGAPLLAAHLPRAWLDVNRSADELDPALIEGVPRGVSNPRVASGLGVVPRVVSGGRAIYRGKIPADEAQARIREVWGPYHATLARLLRDSRDRFGHAILVDCHSMPHEALQGLPKGRRPDVVLGDRYGAAAAPGIVDRVEAAFAEAGFAVSRNAPFAGAYTARQYGRPAEGRHVIQVEIDRALYMDEPSVTPHSGFELAEGADRPGRGADLRRGPGRRHPPRRRVGRPPGTASNGPVARAPPRLDCAHARDVPRLPGDLRRRGPLPRLPVAAHGVPSRTVRPLHRAHGLRRLLCQRREARRPRPARQARDRRRRAAGCGDDGLLHRPDQGRALGHADVPGAAALPRGDHREAPVRGLFRRVAPDPRHDGGDDPRGGAPVAGRGLSRPHGHRAAARRAAGGDARAPDPPDAGRAGHRRLDRAQPQQVPRQDRLGHREAARILGDRSGRDGGVPGPETGLADLGRGRGRGLVAGAGGDSQLRRPAPLGPARPRGPLRRHGRAAVAPGAGRGPAPGRGRRAGEGPVERDDLSRGHRRPGPARRTSLAPGGEGFRPAEGQGAGRAGGGAEAQARRSPPSVAPPRPDRSDADRRPDLPRGARPARSRGRRRPVPASGGRPVGNRSGAGRGRLSATCSIHRRRRAPAPNAPPIRSGRAGAATPSSRDAPCARPGRPGAGRPRAGTARAPRPPPAPDRRPDAPRPPRRQSRS